MSGSRKPCKRVVLKLSGEGLAGGDGSGINAEALQRIAAEVHQVQTAGTQIAIVVGGGNIIRGASLAGASAIPEATAHHMGMLATVINGLALTEALEAAGTPTRAMSALAVTSICEAYSRRDCSRYLNEGSVVVLAGGTGRPFVTTDTAAALAALELDADAVLKATQVDGVYSADPARDPDAEFYPVITYDRVIDERLKVMDISAVDLCQRGRVPIIVFSLHTPGNLKRVVSGEEVGTVISQG